MADFDLPTSAMLELIAQDRIPQLTMNDLIFDLMPIRTVDSAEVVWEQRDNYTGLQQARGLDGEPPSIRKFGLKRYAMQPGFYGEFDTLNETDMTLLRQPGTFATPVNLDELIMPKFEILIGRQIDRIRKILWDLLAQGIFTVAGPNGSIMHTDQFPLQTYTATVPWGTFATATPLADLRNIQLLARGHSVAFDATAMIVVNRGTMNKILNNGNQADIAGRRVTGFNTTGPVNNANELNVLMTRDDLPNFAVYDMGYLDDTGAFNLFIPDGKAIVIGKRPAGQTVGEYEFVRNANNPGFAPGPYQKVINKTELQGLAKIEIHYGHTGGPAIFFPSAIVVVNV